MIAGRKVENIRHSGGYKGRCRHALAAMLTLAIVGSADAQDQTPKLSEGSIKQVKQVEREIDTIIASPGDLHVVEKAIQDAKTIFETRMQYQGADWWETADDRRRVDDLRRIDAMPPQKRGQLQEAASIQRKVNALMNQGKYKEALEPQETALQILKELWGADDPKYAEGLTSLGVLYFRQHRYAEAQSLYQEAMEIRKKSLGENHPEYAISLETLGNLSYGQKQYQEAELLYQRARILEKKAYGEEHPGYDTTLNNLANLYEQQARYADAEPLYRQALAIRKKALGENHLDYAVSLNGLGILYYDQRRYGEAEPLFRQALEVRKKILGEDSSDYGTSLNNLANLYIAQGKYGEAEPLCRQALAIRGKTSGDDSEPYAATMEGLGVLYYHQKRYGEAEPLFKRVLAIRNKAPGENSPEYATTLNNLANLYRQQKRYEEAESSYRGALEIRQRAYGEQSAQYANGLTSLGELFQLQSRYAEAEPLYRQALAIHQTKLGEKDPQSVGSMNNLAQLYRQLGRYGDAEPLLLKVLTIQETSMGGNDPKLATSLFNLADLYRLQGRYGEAEPLFTRALIIQKKTQGEAHPAYATSLNNLADVYRHQDRFAEAETLYRQALAIRKKVLGEQTPAYAASLNNLAQLYQDQLRYGEAEPLYLQALAIRKKVLGEETSDYSRSIFNLAGLYQQQGRYGEAELLYLQAVGIRKKVLGEEHPDYAVCLNALAQLYRREGRYAEAEPLFRQALDIRKKTLGENNPDYATSLNSLAQLYRGQGRYVEAEPLFRQALAIRKETLGEEHPDYAASLQDLGSLLEINHNWTEAAQLLLQACQVNWTHLGANLAALTPAQQRRYLGRFHSAESLWSLVFAGHASGMQGLQAVLWSKQLAPEALRQQSAALREAIVEGTSEWRSKFNQWQLWRQQYESLELRSLDEPSQQKPVDMDYLKNLKQQMDSRELELRQSNPVYARLARLQEVKVENVQSALGSGDALVEYVRYRPYEYRVAKDSWGATYYGALVMHGPGGETQAIELGEAAEIDELVEQYRENMASATERFSAADPSTNQAKKSELELAQISSQLREKVWDKLDGALTGARRVYIAPEGPLCLMPFEAMGRPQPNGTLRYLVEDEEIVYINTARDLARLSLGEVDKVSSGTKGNAVLVTAPAFGATQRELAAAIAVLDKNSPPFEHALSFPTNARGGEGTLGSGPCSTLQGELPPAFPEISQLQSFGTAIGKSLHQHGWTVQTLQGRDASKQSVLAVQHPDLLQFTTHGFFVSHETNPCNKPGISAEDDIGDALLHSMLILAGYNHRSDSDHVFYRIGEELLGLDAAKARGLTEEDLAGARVDVGDGILTAYEVTGMDLEGTRLVNLTACETGVGSVTTEGVVGLREGFLLAGARALTMSLWEVPVEETMQQMSEFYAHWLGTTKAIGKPSTSYEAFHEAQLASLHRARAVRSGSGHPFYWAGTIYVGDPGDLPAVHAATAGAETPSESKKN